MLYISVRRWKRTGTMATKKKEVHEYEIGEAPLTNKLCNEIIENVHQNVRWSR